MLTQWNKVLRRLHKAAEVRTDKVLVPQGAALQFCRFCMNIWRAQDRLHLEVSPYLNQVVSSCGGREKLAICAFA
jgi:hypothetical protein